MGNCGSGEQTKPQPAPTNNKAVDAKPKEETQKVTNAAAAKPAAAAAEEKKPEAASPTKATEPTAEEKKPSEPTAEDQKPSEPTAEEQKPSAADEEAAQKAAAAAAAEEEAAAAAAAAQKKQQEEAENIVAAAEQQQKADEEAAAAAAAAAAKQKEEEEKAAADAAAAAEEAERKKKEEEAAAAAAEEEQKQKEEADKKKAAENEAEAEKEKQQKLDAAIAKYRQDMAAAQVFRPEGPSDPRDLAIHKECLNNPDIAKMKEIFGLDEKIRFREMMHKMRIKKGVLGRQGFHPVLGFIIGNFYFYLPPAAADLKSKKSENVQCLGSMYLVGCKFSEMSDAEGKKRILIESAVPRKLGKGKKPDPAESTLQLGFDNEESLRRFQAAVEAVAVPPMPEEVAAAATKTRGKSFFVGTCDTEPEPGAGDDEGEEEGAQAQAE